MYFFLLSIQDFLVYADFLWVFQKNHYTVYVFCHCILFFSSYGMRDFLETLNSAKQGDRDAIGYLYDMSYEKIYRFVYHRIFDTPKTEDIVSDVFFKMLRALPRMRATSEGEFFSWLYRSAYTTYIDAVRNRDVSSLDSELSIPSIEPLYAQDIDNRDRLHRIEVCLQDFSDRDRAILKMRVWDELPYETIAEIMQESVANTKQIVSRGLRKITARLEHFILCIFIVLL